MSSAVQPNEGPRLPSIKRRGFGIRVSVVFLVLGLILATVAVQVYRRVGDFVSAANWVTHSLTVRQEITDTLAKLHDAEASQRAYLISKSPERLADYSAVLPQIGDHASQLIDLVSDNARQSDRARELSALIHARLQRMAETLQIFERSGLDVARNSEQMSRSRSEDMQIDALGRNMLRLEDELLTTREKQTSEQAMLTRVLTVGAIVCCMAMLVFALFLVLREQRYRRASMEAARSANLDLSQSLEEAQRLSHALRQLSELGEMLQGCRNISEAVNGIEVSMPRLLPGYSGSIGLINASQNLVETITYWGSPPTDESALFGPDDCWALRRGHAYPLAGSIPAFTCRHLEPVLAERPEIGHLCVPMVAQGEMLGILTLTCEHAITSEQRTNIVAATEQISMALANLKLQETLRTQSLRDPLTGLFNRRYLEASLEREVQRAERRGLPLSVLMIDIDYFKRFNDSHGHEAGDALLAQFGALLGRIVRSEDVSCRYGGEEFTVLMPETDIAQGVARAEEICAAVRQLTVQHRNQALDPITVSIGVACHGAHGRTPDELLRNADNALYFAKNSGRDRVKVGETLHAHTPTKERKRSSPAPIPDQY